MSGAAGPLSAYEAFVQDIDFTRQVLESSDDCIKVLSPDGALLFMSAGGARVMEVDDFDTVRGCPWPDFWTGDGTQEARHAVNEARSGRSARFQGFCATAKGTPKWWDVQVTPIFGPDGRTERLLAISREITDLKQAEAHQRLLLDEMKHRVKNTLTLVQALAHQSLHRAASIAQGLQAFTARLTALGAAHDTLTRNDWSNATLQDVVAPILATHTGSGTPQDAPRLHTFGENLPVSPKLAIALALILHELATNAVKYGALSGETGSVDLEWRMVSDGDAPVLQLTWREHGGPTMLPPSRKGFGSQLIERTIAGLAGQAGSKFTESGLLWTASIPLHH